jgi:hypothetical protein
MSVLEGVLRMRWFGIRKAKILAPLRETFEQYGTAILQQVVARTIDFEYGRQPSLIEIHRSEALKWLTEQHDRQDLKETWSLTMEVAITVFVLAELLFSALNYFCRRSA